MIEVDDLRHQVVLVSKMNGNSDNIFINVHRIEHDGNISSIQYEEDFLTHQLLSRAPISSDSIVLDPGCEWNFSSDTKINLNYHYVEPDDSSITVIKLGGIEDLNPMNYATEITTVLSDTPECKQFINNAEMRSKKESKIPNIPTMIRCQNCDTNFPTKYQYQRHQCEFNAEKVVLKADADIKDLDKGVRIKYDCPTCGKQFVSKNNLERHQTSHDSTKRNVCEHCNKHFVSENRLRIHKENHCKKAGDISKFYRSDVAVWKCLLCHQVFATPTSAINHSNVCAFERAELNPDAVQEIQPGDGEVVAKTEEPAKTVKIDQEESNTNVEKVLTELLLQCEFCNRTYAEKTLLSAHQRTHTTAVNYECVTCKETFESYISAAKHWMVKCSDEANLFYLPKLTYCEFCDRTFKSHEILYAHKIKKKHYTPKLHTERDDADNNTNNTDEKDECLDEEKENVEEKKDVIVKLIEDVLTTLSTSLEVMDKKQNGENKEGILQNDSGMDGMICEDLNNLDANIGNIDGNINSDENEKKKRGRKRKTLKQSSSKGNKKLCAVIEKGYRYQCEKCVKVWDNIADLEQHREKEHASNYTCEQCDQVITCFLKIFGCLLFLIAYFIYLLKNITIKNKNLFTVFHI